MKFEEKKIGILGLGKSGYWSAKLAKSLKNNVFVLFNFLHIAKLSMKLAVREDRRQGLRPLNYKLMQHHAKTAEGHQDH